MSKEPVSGQSTKKPWRPFKFQSVEQLQKQIDDYFASCEPHPVEVIEYRWHEIEEEYTTIVKGKEVTKTRMVEDHTRMPEEVKVIRISERESYSVTGLALALDTTRRTLLDYESGQYLRSEDDDDYDPEENALIRAFTHTIKKAKARIENDVQRRLEGNAVAGTIFNLKNNFDWIDKQVEEGTQELIVTTRKHKRS